MYRLKQIDFSGNYQYSDVAEVITVPQANVLYQNYPSPFNPVTKIGFQVAHPGFISLIMHDALGNKISTLVNEEKEPGYYGVDFNGSSLSSGTYYLTLTANNSTNGTVFIQTKKLL